MVDDSLNMRVRTLGASAAAKEYDKITNAVRRLNGEIDGLGGLSKLLNARKDKGGLLGGPELQKQFDKQKVMAKMQKLQNLTGSSNVNEANAAREKLKQFSKKYKVNMGRYDDVNEKSLGKWKGFNTRGGALMKRHPLMAMPLKAAKAGMLNIRKSWMAFLTLMFISQMIIRVTTGAIRNLFENWKKLDVKGVTPLTKSMTKLEASFIFLKYSILEAMGPALTTFIIWIAELAMWVASFDPMALSAIGLGLAGLLALGAVVYTGSQLALLLIALQQLSQLDLASQLPSMQNALTNIKDTLTTGAGIYLTIKGFKQFAEGDLFAGLGKLFSGIGVLSKVNGLLTLGLVLQIVDLVKEGELNLEDKMALIFSSYMFGAKVLGTTAAGYITIGVALVLMDMYAGENFSGKVLETMRNIIEDVGKNLWDVTLGRVFGKSTASTGTLERDFKEKRPKDFGEAQLVFDVGQEGVDYWSETEELIGASSTKIGEFGTALNSSMKTDILPEMDKFNTSITDANTTIKDTQKEWDEWTPKDKVLNITVNRTTSNSSSDGSGVQPITSYG